MNKEIGNIFGNIKERILQIGDFYNVGRKNICEEIGMTYGNFTGKAKDTPINSIAIQNIIAKFPSIDANWLLTGRGSMLREEVPKEVPTQAPQPANTEIIQILISKIEQQAEEIGKLKERLAVFEAGKGHMKGVGDADVAAVG